MLSNILWLALDAILSFLIALIFWRGRYSSFRAWWDAEGIAIWMLSGTLIAVILLAMNKLHRV